MKIVIEQKNEPGKVKNDIKHAMQKKKRYLIVAERALVPHDYFRNDSTKTC